MVTMGNSSYSYSDRLNRSISAGYHSKSKDEIFTQNKERKIHESMSPRGVVFRESRDSEAHPNTVPIQLYLDVTGSMGHIPHDMIKDGLPTLMSTLIQRGVPDAALMFGAIGDHECDRHPLQIGQFESGDAELDMWLTRTYLEGGGGGNAGESYLLAWYFAANHVKTDAFDKRKKKGFVFTIGDEPCLRSLPVSAIKESMGDSAQGQSTVSREELLAAAQTQNHVFHIHLNHGGRTCDRAWKEMLGDRLIEINDYRDVSKVIAETIIDVLSKESNVVSINETEQSSKKSENSSTEEEIIL